MSNLTVFEYYIYNLKGELLEFISDYDEAMAFAKEEAQHQNKPVIVWGGYTFCSVWPDGAEDPVPDEWDLAPSAPRP